MKILQGRVVLVTGAGAGLGASIMKVFAAAGASVVGCARRPDSGESIAASIRAEGGDAMFVAADITAEADRKRFVDACLSKHQRIDILINNAGVTGGYEAVEDLTLDAWNNVLAINLTSAFAMCQLVLPQMRTQRDGVILNISSNASAFAMGQMAAYCSSKAGLNHLTKVLAIEGFKDNVRANVIVLGGTRSEMSDSASSVKNLEEDRKKRMDPDEVATTLAVLCMPQARLITAAEIAVDQAVSSGRVFSEMIHSARLAQAESL